MDCISDFVVSKKLKSVCTRAVNTKILFKVIDTMKVSTLQAVRHAKCNILTEQVDIDNISEWVFA